MLHPQPDAIDAAWARAYLACDVHVVLDAEPLDPAALDAVTRRQAWQFQVLPLRRERGILLLVTTARSLVRAAGFARRVCGEPVLLLVAEEVPFRRYLAAYYPWEGMQDLLG